MRFAAVLAALAATAHAEEVPGEVKLDSGAEIAPLCAGLAEQQAQPTETVYELMLPSAAFKLTYDAQRARAVVDTAAGFHDSRAGYELVLHDLTGEAPAAFDVAVPLGADDAKALDASWRDGKLKLTIWFQVAAAPACATRHDVNGDGVRLAIEPLAWQLAQGAEVIASGDTPAFAELRDADAPIADPAVVISAPVLTHDRGAPPDGVLHAVQALEPDLVGCYRAGLAADPKLRGSLVAGMALASDGSVREATQEIDGLGAPAVSQCILGTLARARFPKNATAPFSVPIQLKSR